MGLMEDFSAEVVPELREGEVIYAQVRADWVGWGGKQNPRCR